VMRAVRDGFYMVYLHEATEYWVPAFAGMTL
jgi:hypothetical protein